MDMKKLFPNHKELSFKFSDMVSKPQSQAIQPKQQPFKFLFPKMQKMPGLSLPSFSFKSLTANKPQNIRGASIQKQVQWKQMPMQDKVLLRMMKKDTDGDNVPDMFDCQPTNPKKQDKVLLPKYLAEKKNVYVQASPKIKGTIYKQFRKYPELMQTTMPVPTTIMTNKNIKHFGHLIAPDQTDQERKIELRENTFKQKYDIDFEKYVKREHNPNPQPQDLETYYGQLLSKEKFTAKNRPVRTMLHEYRHVEQIKEHDTFPKFTTRYNSEPDFKIWAEDDANKAAKKAMQFRDYRKNENKFTGEELQDFSMFTDTPIQKTTHWKEVFVPSEPLDIKKKNVSNIKYRGNVFEKGKQQRLRVNEELRGASEAKQEEWKETPQEEKVVDRITMPDIDMDGTPDEFDCEPTNPDKQDTEITVGGQMLETYTPEKRKNPFQIITEDGKTIDWESMEEQVFENGENLFRKTTSMNKEEKMADLLERANIVYPLTFGGMSKWSQNIRGTDLESVDTPDNAPMQQEYYAQAQQAINTIPSYYLQAAQQFIQRNPSYFVGKDLNRAKRYIANALIQGQDPVFAAQNISDYEDYEDY
jgi:hypothetical protein